MLDWSGEVIRRFDLSKNVANVFLVGARGKLLLTMNGLPDKATLEKLLSAIDSGWEPPTGLPWIPQSKPPPRGLRDEGVPHAYSALADEHSPKPILPWPSPPFGFVEPRR
jgi:hypothetical protein